MNRGWEVVSNRTPPQLVKGEQSKVPPRVRQRVEQVCHGRCEVQRQASDVGGDRVHHLQAQRQDSAECSTSIGDTCSRSMPHYHGYFAGHPNARTQTLGRTAGASAAPQPQHHPSAAAHAPGQ